YAGPMPVESDMAVPHTIEDWFGALGPMPFAEAVRDAARTVVVSADMIVGFCDEGPLASPRIGALKTGVARLFRRAHDAGIRHFVLLQDTHDPDAIEFDAFPVHCVRGTHESDTVEELRTLPFSDLFTVVPKNTLTPA